MAATFDSISFFHLFDFHNKIVDRLANNIMQLGEGMISIEGVLSFPFPSPQLMVKGPPHEVMDM